MIRVTSVLSHPVIPAAGDAFVRGRADNGGVSVLGDPLSSRLGEKTASALGRALDLHTVQDLLEYVPRRYVTRGELTPIDHLQAGEQVTLVAEVVEAIGRPMRARRGSLLEVRIGDTHGELLLTFFNQGWRASALVPGARGMFSGRVQEYRGRLQLSHPDYELFDAEGDDPDPARWANALLPVYPAKTGVPSWRIARSIGILLDELTAEDVPDALSPEQRAAAGVLSTLEAYRGIHRPSSRAQAELARATLAFQEALILQTSLLRTRARLRQTQARPRPGGGDGFLAQFDAHCPFELTPGQREVGDEISEDLVRAVPMNRLLQGDVGAGKTLVALRAMLQVAETGGQSALLVPTEVLAVQHLHSISAQLGPELLQAVAPTLITGSMGATERRSALLKVVSGRSKIVVGTHALLNEATQFDDLGLVVIDEQHRFGVQQREQLREGSGRVPHMLLMTATPIPRTLAMTVFGDLDISTLHGLPGGRSPVQTFVVPAEERPDWYARVWSRIAEEARAGHRVFIVCGTIDAGADQERASVEATARELKSRPETRALPSAVLHGRMSADEKRVVMDAFVSGRVPVLLATTVIEVGVDVPEATLMVVMDAERFGVSQLHQLRGRIGRGALPGTALLVTRAPEGSPGRQRVEAVASTTDGFALAELDLEQRSEGDVLGDTQSGRADSLRLLRVGRRSDQQSIARARSVAEDILGEDPELAAHQVLRGLVETRLGGSEAAHLRRG